MAATGKIHLEKQDDLHAPFAGGSVVCDFLLSAEGQGMIANFGKDKYGQPLFFADGGKTEKDFGL